MFFTSLGLRLPVCGGWACSGVSKDTMDLVLEKCRCPSPGDPGGSQMIPRDPESVCPPIMKDAGSPTVLGAGKTQPLRGRVVSLLFPGVPDAKSWPEGRLGEKYPGMWECVLRKMNLSREGGLRRERRSNPTGSLSLRAEFCPEGCCGPDRAGYGGYGLGLSPAPGWPWTPGSRGQAERSLSATDDLEGGSHRMP